MYENNNYHSSIDDFIKKLLISYLISVVGEMLRIQYTKILKTFMSTKHNHIMIEKLMCIVHAHFNRLKVFKQTVFRGLLHFSNVKF